MNRWFVIRFKSPRGIDFSYLLLDDQGQLHVTGQFHRGSRGSKLDLAMQLILTPMICSSWNVNAARSSEPARISRAFPSWPACPGLAHVYP